MGVALCLLTIDIVAPVALFIPMEWAFYRYHLIARGAFTFWYDAVFYLPLEIEQKSPAYHRFFQTQIIWSQPMLF